MRRQRLIDARKRSGKSQEKVGQEIGVNRNQIGEYEAGESTPHPDKWPKYAEAIGLTVDELQAILSSVPLDNETPEWLSDYLDKEQSASELRAHEPRAVHGLLQTRAYAEHLVGRVGISGASDTYVQRSVELRVYRQKRVRNGDVSLDVIQPESALDLRVGGADVMAEQLRTVVELAELPNVTVRITTHDVGQYEARRLGYFIIMTHPWGNARVQMEGYGGGRTIKDRDEVAYFAAAFDRATTVALSPEDSLQFVRMHAEHWEKQR